MNKDRKNTINKVILNWLNSNWFGILDKEELEYILASVCDLYFNQHYNIKTINEILEVLEGLKSKFRKKLLEKL